METQTSSLIRLIVIFSSWSLHMHSPPHQQNFGKTPKEQLGCQGNNHFRSCEHEAHISADIFLFLRSLSLSLLLCTPYLFLSFPFVKGHESSNTLPLGSFAIGGTATKTLVTL